MIRPTVVHSFLRVLFCLFVVFQVYCRLYLYLSLSGCNPDDEDTAPCAISGVCYIAFSIFLFSSLFVLLFAFGLVSSGASRYSRF